MSNSWEAEMLRGCREGRAKVERRSGIPFDWRGALEEEETGSRRLYWRPGVCLPRGSGGREDGKEGWHMTLVKLFNNIHWNLNNSIFTWVINAQGLHQTWMVSCHHESRISSLIFNFHVSFVESFQSGSNPPWKIKTLHLSLWRAHLVLKPNLELYMLYADSPLVEELKMLLFRHEAYRGRSTCSSCWGSKMALL